MLGFFAPLSLLNSKKKCTKNNSSARVGMVKISDWCAIMERTVGLKVTWRMLCPKIARVDAAQGLVQYESTFDECYLTNTLAQGGPTFLESLYRNKEALETIFRIMDKDGSGKMSAFYSTEEICTKIYEKGMKEGICYRRLS